MKNLFDVNVNTNQYDGTPFYSRSVSKELETLLTDNQWEAYDLLKKIGPYLIIELVLVAVCFLIIQSEIDGHGIAELLQVSRHPVKSLLLVISAAGMVVVHMISRKKKSVVTGALDQTFIPTEEQLLQRAREELDIPANWLELEVISDPYELVKDWKYLKHKNYSDNLVMEVYQREDNLCFFSGAQELAIPFTEIIATVPVHDNRVIGDWLKDVKYNEEPYKKYRVRPRRTNNPGYVIHGYYQIIIQHDDQQYQILVPDYEEETVNRILQMVNNHKGD